MRRDRSTFSILGEPVLVGAITVLVTAIGVWLSYNANRGLPFVPTYELQARVPDAAELVAGNDVRIGGRRVGTITHARAEQDARGRVDAVLALKLDVTAEPLPVDTRVTVRQSSLLGVKYLELTPGTARRGVRRGGTLPLRNAQPIVELDEAMNAFDADVRVGLRKTLRALGTGVAGRGADLNEAIGHLAPLARDIRPVFHDIASPKADLRGFLRGAGAAADALAPVARPLALLFDSGATTSAAIGDAAAAVEGTLARAPAVERDGTVALRELRPVLADGAALAAALRPGARRLPLAARRLNDALETGIPVLRRALPLGPQLETVLRAVGALARDPHTSGSLRRLTEVVTTLGPLLRRVNPFQTRCNYLGLWARNASAAISEGDVNGNWFRMLAMPHPPEMLQSRAPAPELHTSTYSSLDGECEGGNEPYLSGQRIGPVPGRQATVNELTTRPAGTPEGPR